MDATVIAGCAVAGLVPALGIIYAVNPWGIVHGKGPGQKDDEDQRVI